MSDDVRAALAAERELELCRGEAARLAGRVAQLEAALATFPDCRRAAGVDDSCTIGQAPPPDRPQG